MANGVPKSVSGSPPNTNGYSLTTGSGVSSNPRTRSRSNSLDSAKKVSEHSNSPPRQGRQDLKLNRHRHLEGSEVSKTPSTKLKANKHMSSSCERSAISNELSLSPQSVTDDQENKTGKDDAKKNMSPTEALRYYQLCKRIEEDANSGINVKSAEYLFLLRTSINEIQNQQDGLTTAPSK